ncbi:MAG: hypothetical protein U5N85_23470 [Arcicella sp.]|nr:hypothetical protein [Arcicella sp.]
MKKLILGLTISLFTISCKSESDDKLCKKWDIGKINPSADITKGRFAFDFYSNDLSRFHKDNNDYIRFFEDGTMVITIYSKFNIGVWKRVNNDDINCTVKNQQFNFTIIRLTDDSLIFAYDMLQKKSKSAPFFNIFSIAENFHADNQDFSEDKFDPFSIKNNAWRTTPSIKETEEQIKKRSISHVDYLIAYHNYAINKGGLISFDGLNSPFAMTGEGISFTNDYDSASWKSCFFDNKDADLGFYLMDEAYRKVKPNENKDETNIVKYSLDYLVKMRKEME